MATSREEREMTSLYEIGERVSAEIPGGVTVIGPIVEKFTEFDGTPAYRVEQVAGGKDDGSRYAVRQDEIKVVLDG
jgi:hypothetical protein